MQLHFRTHWNTFVSASPAGSFLQSYDWGLFQNEAGNHAHVIIATEKRSFTVDFTGEKKFRGRGNDKWRMAALVLTHPLPFGKTFLYAPRGPLVDFLSLKKPVGVFEIFLREVRQLAERENAIFFRMDPEWAATKEIKEFLKRVGLRESSKDVQPRETIILDLTKSEEEILASMRPKTRYNIRLAERKEVTVSKNESVTNGYFERVWPLFEETVKRDGFHLHTRKYYENMLVGGGSGLSGRVRSSPSDPVGELFTAEYKGTILAANITIFFGPRATYLHGASSNDYRNSMAPYLLHWETIKEAKRRGCTEYDLWGVSEKKWPGVTRFKRGFGGNEARYAGTYDYPLDRLWYTLYTIIQKLRKRVS